MKIDPEKWYSEPEVADIYGIGPKALRRRLNAGLIQMRFSILGSRRLFLGRDILDELNAASSKPNRTQHHPLPTGRGAGG